MESPAFKQPLNHWPRIQNIMCILQCPLSKLLYKQATTNLAFHSNEAVNNIKLTVYYCHPGPSQTTQKCVHFYMLIIILKHKKVVEVCEKKVYSEKQSFIELAYVTYVVGAHWNCLYEAIPMCTNNICYLKLTYTLIKNHAH